MKKNLSLFLLIAVALFGVGLYASGYMGGNPTRVIENVEVYNEAPAIVDTVVEETLGTSFEGSEFISYGGVTEFNRRIDCRDATTTIFATYNRIGDIVVDEVIFNVTGAIGIFLVFISHPNPFGFKHS